MELLGYLQVTACAALISYIALLWAWRCRTGAYQLRFLDVLLSSLLLTILLCGVLAAGWFILAGILQDWEYLGMLIIALIEMALAMLTSIFGCWLLLGRAGITRSQLSRISLGTGLLLPVLALLLLAGTYWTSAKVKDQQRKYEQHKWEEVHVLKPDEAQAKVEEYSLPQLYQGIYAGDICRRQPGEELYYYSTTANASYCFWSPEEGKWVQNILKWKEYSDFLGREAETMLQQAGYSVERSEGAVHKFYTREGEVSLPDIVLHATRDKQAVRIIIGYEFTEGIAFPPVDVQFGAADQLSSTPPPPRYY
jgi:hypothetical protein